MNAPYQQPGIINYSKHIADSFRHWTGRDLITVPPETLAEALYHAPFVVVSHGTQADPVFRYANLTAQKLWGYAWDEFITLPSRMSAEPDARDARQQLLAQAGQNGFVDNYKGVRITKDGRRFAITQCILWNVLDTSDKKFMRDKIGQAATFTAWEWLS